VACIIWSKITSWGRDVNSRDRDETLVRLETETSRPRPHPWPWYTVQYRIVKVNRIWTFQSSTTCHSERRGCLTYLFRCICPREWVSRGLTSHSTLYRSFWGRFLCTVTCVGVRERSRAIYNSDWRAAAGRTPITPARIVAVHCYTRRRPWKATTGRNADRESVICSFIIRKNSRKFVKKIRRALL